ncbi:hypothetical protein DFH07DRAFT_768876 [Mycena maculata]|uniref:Uncharacterized protein n=1 Tax=Mycena maculata TaxID=230809 RepID=A0AAD7JQ50_9AGAR|nr:hypothetical protein DFH07DRAFT_768876 [Mycena maculata]
MQLAIATVLGWAILSFADGSCGGENQFKADSVSQYPPKKYITGAFAAQFESHLAVARPAHLEYPWYGVWLFICEAIFSSHQVSGARSVTNVVVPQYGLCGIPEEKGKIPDIVETIVVLNRDTGLTEEMIELVIENKKKYQGDPNKVPWRFPRVFCQVASQIRNAFLMRPQSIREGRKISSIATIGEFWSYHEWEWASETTILNAFSTEDSDNDSEYEAGTAATAAASSDHDLRPRTSTNAGLDRDFRLIMDPEIDPVDFRTIEDLKGRVFTIGSAASLRALRLIGHLSVLQLQLWPWAAVDISRNNEHVSWTKQSRKNYNSAYSAPA